MGGAEGEGVSVDVELLGRRGGEETQEWVREVRRAKNGGRGWRGGA